MIVPAPSGSMSSVTPFVRTVLALTPQHDALATELAELDSLSTELRDSEEELEQLRNRAIDEELRVNAARRRVQQRWKAKVAEQTPAPTNVIEKTVSRFVVPPKPDEAQMKGFAEYLSELDKCGQEEQSLDTIRNEIAVSMDKTERLRTRVTNRDQIFTELDLLYKLAFDGPTPDFPEEDVMEFRLARVESQHSRLMELRDTHKHMRKHLENALHTARQLESHYRTAVRCSEDAMILRYSLMSSNEENSDEFTKTMGICRHLAGELELHVRQANTIVPRKSGRTGRSDSPSFVSITQVDIPYMAFKTGKTFSFQGNQVEGQMPLRDTPAAIQRSADTSIRALRELEFETQRAEARALQIQADLAEVASETATLRLQLHALRRSIFQRVAKDHAPPPPVEVPSAAGSGIIASPHERELRSSLVFSSAAQQRQATVTRPIIGGMAPIEDPPEYARN